MGGGRRLFSQSSALFREKFFLAAGFGCALGFSNLVGFSEHSGVVNGVSGSGNNIARMESKKWLYSWGGNTFGQLGIGSASDEATPSRVNEDMTDLDVVSVDAFGQSSGFVTQKGEVFTFGRSIHGSIGLGSRVENCSVPVAIPELENAVKVTMGEFHFAALDQTGTLWTSGRGWNGELGRTGGDHSVPEPVPGMKFKDVACGTNFTVAIDSDGSVLTTGSGRQGTLGHGDLESRSEFSKIDPKHFGGKKAVQVEAGEEVTLVLTEDSQVYTFGCDDYGKLGLGSKSTSRIQSTPQLVRKLSKEKIVQVSAGDMHCGAVSANGKLFLWGAGGEGRLGTGKTSDLAMPTQVQTLKDCKVKQVACGGSHTLVLIEEGKVFSFGKGRSGQLGEGETVESIAAYRSHPHNIAFFNKTRSVTCIAAGRDHSFAVC